MKTQVFDNGGVTLDRFTIIIGDDMFGASDNPFHPLGFGQYCGDAPHGDLSFLGKKVNLKNLPEDVRRYINYLK